MLWRQGDVFIERIVSLPRRAVPRTDLILAEGEITGHSHRIADRETATLYNWANNGLLLVVHRQGATVLHEEHGPIELTPGNYRVWRQREFDPGAARFGRFAAERNPFEASTRAAVDRFSRPVWD